MKSLSLGWTLMCATALMASAQDNSRNNLDWPGNYTTGKDLYVALMQDNTYTVVQDGKTVKGTLVWGKDGNTITLPANHMRFRVEEGRLVGMRYGTRLHKMNIVEPAPPAPSMNGDALYGGKWMLIELNGQPVESYNANAKKAFVSFDAGEMRFSGYSGCNTYGGSFELPGNGRIRFGQALSTMKACISEGTDAEPLLMKALRTADNFTIKDGVLSLNKARMAPLARFQMIVR